MFSVRNKGENIIFVNRINEKSISEKEFHIGDDVVLHIGDEKIKVKITYYDDNNKFKGNISGFNPHISIQFNGLQLGQEINFNEDNIYSVTRNNNSKK